MCVWVQVVEVLTDALTLPETPVPSKAARLLLVSDVLHNRCAPPPPPPPPPPSCSTDLVTS